MTADQPFPTPDGYTDLVPSGRRIGLADVYDARDLDSGDRVVLTVLSRTVTEDTRFGAYAAAIFERLTLVQHRSIALVHRFGESTDDLWAASELPPGRTVTEVVADGTIPLKQAIALFTPLASALRTAAEYGMRYYDLDSGNVWITEDNRALLLESAFIDPLAIPGGHAARPDLLDYLPPERLRGARPDQQTNVYLLGGLLLYALTGCPPGTAAARVLHDRQRPGAVPEAIDHVLLRALAVDPLQRPNTPRDLFYELEAAMSDTLPERRISAPQPKVTGARVPTRDLVRLTPTGPGFTHAPRARAPRSRLGGVMPWRRISKAPPVPTSGDVPRGRPFPSRRRHVRFGKTLTGAVVLTVTAGAVALSTGSDDADIPPETTRRGPVRVTHPATWQRVTPQPNALGVTLRNVIVLEPRGVRRFVAGSAALVIGRVPGTVNNPPAAWRTLLRDARTTPMTIGKLRGTRSVGLRRSVDTGRTDLYLVKTSVGTLAMACFSGDELKTDYRTQCASIVRTLRVAR